MVDISKKEVTERAAAAFGRIRLGRRVARALRERSLPKGDALAAARIAAISAAKRAAYSIPLCHPVRIGGIEVDLKPGTEDMTVTCRVTGLERTGYEMEALSGVTAALLTVYDMCKAISREMVIEEVRLLQKSGGRSGEYRWRE
jgi:cyclic pyranopterin phosphate synthase